MNIELLKKLCETFASTRNQERIAEIISSAFDGSGYNVEVDPLGNVIAKKGDGPYRVFATHLDQRGWVVEYKDKSGTLHLKPLPVFDGLGEGWAVDSQGGKYRVFKQDDGKTFRAYSVSNTGGAIGSFVVPDGPFIVSEDSIFSHALSDRAGVALLLSVSRNIPGDSLAFVFYAKRHLNFMGLSAALRKLDISRVYFVDGFPVSNQVVSGGGAVMMLRGQRCVAPVDWVEEVEDISSKNNVKIQRALSLDTTTPSDMVSREGITSITFAVPVQFYGSNIEKIACSDYSSLSDLLAALGKGEV